MKASAALRKEADSGDCWKGFRPGDWLTSIDVRDFISANATPYTGDEKFLVGPSKRTKAVWEKLQPYFQEERKKGVLAVDVHSPSTMLAHKPGYIDQANEVIVGLQTDQPFKRAIFPFGGLRMVEAGLKAAGFVVSERAFEFTAMEKNLGASLKAGTFVGEPETLVASALRRTVGLCTQGRCPRQRCSEKSGDLRAHPTRSHR